MSFGKTTAQEFIRITTKSPFIEDNWNSLLDEQFEFRRRNDDEDYDQGTQLHFISSSKVPFLNKREYIDFLSDKNGGGPYTKGVWNIKDFVSNITNHDESSFRIYAENNNIVIMETGKERHYTTQRIIFHAIVNSLCKIVKLNAHFKPLTLKIEKK